MKFKLIVGFILPFLLFLTGCNSQPVVLQTSTPAFTPSSTFSPRQITATADRARDIENMNFRFTAVPATIEARGAKCRQGFALERSPYILDTSTDQWTLFTCSPQNAKDWKTPGAVDFGTRYTQLIKTDFSHTWTIQHDQFDYSPINRPQAMLAPFHWTTNGRYVYLVPIRYPLPGGGDPSYISLRTLMDDLYRINLETGEFELVLQKKRFDALALSPDEQYLMYSQWDEPDVIHMLDLGSGEDTQLKLNENLSASGDFVWNPQGTLVMFIGGYGHDKQPSGVVASGTSIFVLNPGSMHIRKILSEDPRAFVFSDCFNNNQYWLDDQTICLSPSNDEEGENDHFTINIETGNILFLQPSLEPTATAAPKP